MPYVTSWERMARTEGRNIGRKEGKKEGKLETAKRMLNSGVSLKDIIKYTGLKKTEIEKLISEVSQSAS